MRMPPAGIGLVDRHRAHVAGHAAARPELQFRLQVEPGIRRHHPERLVDRVDLRQEHPLQRRGVRGIERSLPPPLERPVASCTPSAADHVEPVDARRDGADDAEVAHHHAIGGRPVARALRMKLGAQATTHGEQRHARAPGPQTSLGLGRRWSTGASAVLPVRSITSHSRQRSGSAAITSIGRIARAVTRRAARSAARPSAWAATAAATSVSTCREPGTRPGCR